MKPGQIKSFRCPSGEAGYQGRWAEITRLEQPTADGKCFRVQAHIPWGAELKTHAKSLREAKAKIRQYWGCNVLFECKTNTGG